MNNWENKYFNELSCLVFTGIALLIHEAECGNQNWS